MRFQPCNSPQDYREAAARDGYTTSQHGGVSLVTHSNLQVRYIEIFRGPNRPPRMMVEWRNLRELDMQWHSTCQLTEAELADWLETWQTPLSRHVRHLG